MIRLLCSCQFTHGSFRPELARPVTWSGLVFLLVTFMSCSKGLSSHWIVSFNFHVGITKVNFYYITLRVLYIHSPHSLRLQSLKGIISTPFFCTSSSQSRMIRIASMIVLVPLCSCCSLQLRVQIISSFNGCILWKYESKCFQSPQ